MVNATAIVLIVAGAILLFCYKKYLKLSNEDSSEPVISEAPAPVPDCSVLSEQQLFLRNRLELGEGENPEKELPLSADLLLISILDQMKLANMGKAKKMLIKCGSTQKEITDEYEILSFDIREFIKSHPEGKSVKTIIFHIEFEEVDVMVTLLASGKYSENSRYFRLWAYSLLDTGKYNCYISLIEVRFSDGNQDYWEAKYMIDEAKRALDNENDENMTDKVVATLSELSPNVSYNFYWGKKYYNKAISSSENSDFIHQALFYLYRVDEEFRKRLDALSENGASALFEVNLYIGHLLLLNRDFAKAYNYLELGRRTNYTYAEAYYVDCLCQLMHPFAEDAIKQILARLLHQINEVENTADLTNFNRFLNRRLVYLYRCRGRYADAELILNRMLANGEDDPQYIKAELAEINKEKEQANQGDAQSAES